MVFVINENNPNYSRDLAYMLGFLLSAEVHFNSLLNMHGYLTLDYVLDYLGIDHEPYWVLGWDTKMPQDDNFVDLGLGDLRKVHHNFCFVRGYTRRLNDSRIINVKAHYRGLTKTPEQIELDINVPHYAHLPIDHLF